MTKRFNYHIDEVGVYYYICDNTKKGDAKIILELDTKFEASEVCYFLNALNDENERLKKDNKRLRGCINEIYTITRLEEV